MNEQVLGSSAPERILPTREFDLFGGRVRAFAFGKPLDWRHMRSQNKLDQFALLARYVRECGVTQVFTALPDEVTNLKGDAVIRERSVGTVIDDDPDLFPKKVEVGGVTFFFSGGGDGVRLTKRGACFLPSADCPTLVFDIPKGPVVCCHGGRDSLIEPAHIRAISHSQYKSVAIAAMEGWFGRLQGVRSAALLSIHQQWLTHRFDHPVYGEVNRKFAEHLVNEFGPEVVGKPFDQCPVNLVAVAKVQLRRLGVPTDPDHFFVDPADTATEVDARGDYLWHSCRRGDATRNGVLVVRLP